MQVIDPLSIMYQALYRQNTKTLLLESRDVLWPLESLKEKLFEEEARQSDWSEKCNANDNVLLSRNRTDRKRSKASGSARKREKVKEKFQWQMLSLW